MDIDGYAPVFKNAANLRIHIKNIYFFSSSKRDTSMYLYSLIKRFLFAVSLDDVELCMGNLSYKLIALLLIFLIAIFSGGILQ